MHPKPRRSSQTLGGKEADGDLRIRSTERSGRLEGEFEAAFGEAKGIISSVPGFIDLELQRCVEMRNRYLLLVHWDTLQDHTVGFRSSAEYQRWKALLHHFYDPFPTVEHYEKVHAA